MLSILLIPCQDSCHYPRLFCHASSCAAVLRHCRTLFQEVVGSRVNINLHCCRHRKRQAGKPALVEYIHLTSSGSCKQGTHISRYRRSSKKNFSSFCLQFYILLILFLFFMFNSTLKMMKISNELKASSA